MTVADVAAAAGRNQVPLGIAYMVGSTVMFAGGNAVVKWQLATYPLGEVAFGRTLFAFLTVVAIILPRAGWSVLRTRRYREHLQRGLSQFGSMLCWFLAVSVLSLGSATAIGFAAPLFTTLLSIVILKEKVGIHRWSALIVGFVGVLIITHYTRILEFIKPDFVHVLVDGRFVLSGGPEVADRLEETGYSEWAEADEPAVLKPEEVA